MYFQDVPSVAESGLFALGMTDFLRASQSTPPKVGKKLQTIKTQLKWAHTLKKPH